MRPVLSLLVVAGLAVSLAGCSTSGSSPTASGASSDCAVTASGKASDQIKVTGDFGKKPTVDVAAPASATKTERTVVIDGDGDQVAKGDKVNVDISIFNGTSGEELQGTAYNGTTTPFTVGDANLLPGISKTLDCSTIGSRVVGVIPPADAFGATGSTDLNITAKDSLVFVIDVVSLAPKALAKANGADQAPVAGFPTVKLADDGKPTITIPKADPPTKLGIEVLKKGDGAKVADGANVTVHYTGINWNTKKQFDSSWDRGAPADFATSGVIEGFGKGLVGQTVGSQVVIVIPPDLGYGPSGGTTGIGKTDTIVFVVDILATS